MQLLMRGIVFFGIYVALVLSPLALALLTDAIPQPRPWLLEYAVGLGFIAFAVIALEFALVGRLRTVAEPFGIDALMQFHRLMGKAAVLFVLLHVALLAQYSFSWQMFNPFAAEVAVQAAAVALWALMILVISSLLRARLHLRYEGWQRLHATMAMTIVMASLVHMLAVKHYLSATLLRVVLMTYAALFLALMVHYRLLRPLKLWRRPWRIVENRVEGGDTQTLCVQAVGHAGLNFEPGQFVWLGTARWPFVMEQHPISIASSAEQPRILELSIKALGDWSRQVVPKLKVGERVWIDGSYGVFTPERLPGQAFMLIAGGVGITPMRSMLLTIRDRADVRPITLLYAASRLERMIYLDELRTLEHAINLKCVFVLEDPPTHWQGESGYINTALLQRYLPKQMTHSQYFICGPVPMMNAVTDSLLQLQVPAECICTERFSMG